MYAIFDGTNAVLFPMCSMRELLLHSTCPQCTRVCVLSVASCQTRVSNDCLSLVSEAGKMLDGAGTAHPPLDARRPICIRRRRPPPQRHGRLCPDRCVLVHVEDRRARRSLAHPLTAHCSSLFTLQKRTRLPQDRRSPAGWYNGPDQGPFAALRPPYARRPMPHAPCPMPHAPCPPITRGLVASWPRGLAASVGRA